MRIFYLFICILFLTFCSSAFPAGIPSQAKKYHRLLVRSAHVSPWGLDAPLADFAGQVHAESMWRSDAKSWVGAAGLAQFMPGTATWFSKLRGLGDAEPYNPAWSLRALAEYDYWLFTRVQAHDVCHQMAFTLSAYNGGLGWVNRDKKKAAAAGLDPLDYWHDVSTVNAGRKESAIRENRAYPDKILHRFAPLYVDAGWGESLCRGYQ